MVTWHSILSRWIKPWTTVSSLSRIPPIVSIFSINPYVPSDDSSYRYSSKVKDHPVSEKRLAASSPAASILGKDSSIKVNFDPHPDAIPKSRQMVRFPENPQANWGPKARAKMMWVTIDFTFFKTSCLQIMCQHRILFYMIKVFFWQDIPITVQNIVLPVSPEVN